MKFSSLSLATLICLSTFSSFGDKSKSSFLVQAQGNRNRGGGGGNGNGNGGGGGGGNGNGNGRGPLRYIVKIGQNPEADVVINAKRKNGKFVKKLKRVNSLVINFPNENAVEEFKGQGYELEIDQIRTFDAGFRGALEDVVENASRHLAEETPWGIDNVYEDSNGNPSIPPASYFPETLTHPICIIDSGYSITHPDLPNTASAADPSQNSGSLYFGEDGCAHGTHVAGTVAAIDNEEGVIGVYPGANGIKVVRVFANSCGWAYTSDLIDAAEHCRDSGAKIISMSLGGSWSSTSESSAFQNLFDNDNMLTIAAAGNGGNSAYSYPASYNSIMSVGANDINNNIASFSQFNDQVDISGPGVGVKSTTGTAGYSIYSGTSMATPHVSGVALVLWNKHPGCTNAQIRTALEQSAKDLGAPGRDNYYGHGAVKYWAADTYLTNNPCGGSPPPPQTPSPTPAPEPVCDGTFDFAMEFKTDYWGYETGWELKHASGSLQQGIVVDFGNGYGNQETVNIFTPNLPCDCYTLEFSDSYGDGIYEPPGFINVISPPNVNAPPFTTGYSYSLDFGTCSVPQWVEITNDDFEGGWGSFTQGEAGTKRFVPNGNGALRLLDFNGGTSTATQSSPQDVSGYSKLRVSFDYMIRTMDSDNIETLSVQLSTDGGAFETIQSFSPNENNVMYQESFDYPITGANGIKIRFSYPGSANSDYVYLDNVMLEGEV